MRMNIVMPMAGLGTRFIHAGYKVPKPLISVHNRPMYSWATDSLPLSLADNLVFILLESQPYFLDLKNDILKRYCRYHPIILAIPDLTRGQSETVLAAKNIINNSRPLLIHNADTAFTIDNDWIHDLRTTRPDGALLVFESDESRWSFSRTNSEGRVVEVREKQPISCWASTGTYYFREGRDFIRLAEHGLQKNTTEAGEFYVAPLYNELIREGGFVKNYSIKDLFCFGTPEDMTRSLRLISKVETLDPVSTDPQF